ncbi:ribonuclease H-like domain-containing protein [Tanacetum coccineum]
MSNNNTSPPSLSAQHQFQSPSTAAHNPPIIPDPSHNPNPVSVHPMVTRYRVGSNHPPERLNLHVSSVSPLPKSYRDAFNDSNWQNAMCDEYHALIKNNTWTLVPRPTDTNIVRCMWLFRHKYHADGTLSRYKARLVANGSTQLEGVDVDETFSPVVKPGTIRTVLSLATSRHWPVHQLDVKNAFLHGSIPSYNNMSGRIPSSTQLHSFGPLSYSGNVGLCGPPLTTKCPADEKAEASDLLLDSG